MKKSKTTMLFVKTKKRYARRVLGRRVRWSHVITLTIAIASDKHARIWLNRADEAGWIELKLSRSL